MTSSMTVDELRAFMAEHDIPEPEGSGREGKVLKKDLLEQIKTSGINTKGAKKETKIVEEKPKTEPKTKKVPSKTANLKLGDKIHYVEEGKYDFEAIVTGTFSSSKVIITPLTYVNEEVNPDIQVNFFRKFMTTISDEAPDDNSVKVTIKGAKKTVTLSIQAVDIDQLSDAITSSILDASGIKYVKK